MPECWDSNPPERLRVFISSAQREENGLAWADVRRRIKDTLAKCAYLNPFIIEDTPSAMPSTAYFKRQVERADLVVFLIKGDVRPGTATEFSLASELKKPFFVYFCKDEAPELSVVALKKEIQATDRCTYCEVDSFDDIEIRVRKDVMSSLVRAHQDFYYHPLEAESKDASDRIPEDKGLSWTGVPSKAFIDKFSSCYHLLPEMLDISLQAETTTESEFHAIGSSLIHWLMTGEWKISDEMILDFIQACSDSFSSCDWLQKRWDAIRNYQSDRLEAALSDE